MAAFYACIIVFVHACRLKKKELGPENTQRIGSPAAAFYSRSKRLVVVYLTHNTLLKEKVTFLW